MKTILLATVVLLGSCATPYQKESWSGGYSDFQLNEKVFKISYRGNGTIGSTTVYQYFLRRCAEVTIENGYLYFIIENEQNQTSHSQIQIGQGTAHTNATVSQFGNSSYAYQGTTSYTPPQTMDVPKHSREGTIVVFKEGEQPYNAINAKHILKKLNIDDESTEKDEQVYYSDIQKAEDQKADISSLKIQEDEYFKNLPAEETNSQEANKK